MISEGKIKASILLNKETETKKRRRKIKLHSRLFPYVSSLPLHR
ncbi:hypothetical protein HMPREF3038_01550 [Akkermansia sp. KLE1797]|nr:hypothetical protein HMPREF3038_01550 [Akkermansia sp. KLE1797]